MIKAAIINNQPCLLTPQPVPIAALIQVYGERALVVDVVRLPVVPLVVIMSPASKEEMENNDATTTTH